MISKVLRQFLKTSTSDDKYSLLYRENLKKPIQRQLSRTENSFSESVSAFLKSSLTFEHFEKNDDPHSRIIGEITDCERRG